MGLLLLLADTSVASTSYASTASGGGSRRRHSAFWPPNQMRDVAPFLALELDPDDEEVALLMALLMRRLRPVGDDHA